MNTILTQVKEQAAQAYPTFYTIGLPAIAFVFVVTIVLFLVLIKLRKNLV